MAKRRLPDELMFIQNIRAVQKTTTASMAGKVCVVSGSTSGVGLEAARHLARGNAHVVLLCRNAEKADRVRTQILTEYPVQVDIVLADFEDLAQVRSAAATLLTHYPRIDVLINSAGLHN